jgi:hypothetical protein
MPRNCRKDVARPGFASCVRRRNFTLGMHQTAVSDWSQYRGEREFMAEHARLQIAISDGHCAARTKQNVSERPAVFR